MCLWKIWPSKACTILHYWSHFHDSNAKTSKKKYLFLFGSLETHVEICFLQYYEYRFVLSQLVLFLKNVQENVVAIELFIFAVNFRVIFMIQRQKKARKKYLFIWFFGNTCRNMFSSILWIQICSILISSIFKKCPRKCCRYIIIHFCSKFQSHFHDSKAKKKARKSISFHLILGKHM